MLDAVFHALADPTRRAMLRSLAQRERSIGGLAAPFEMSLEAVSKHIRVLERAGLVRRRVRGRIHLCRPDARPMHGGIEWMRYYAVVRSDEIERCRKACSRSGYRARRALSTWYARTPTGMRLAEIPKRTLDLNLT
jgi:DNA-binding transcriptional ArsR family regulator